MTFLVRVWFDAPYQFGVTPVRVLRAIIVPVAS